LAFRVLVGLVVVGMIAMAGMITSASRTTTTAEGTIEAIAATAGVPEYDRRAASDTAAATAPAEPSQGQSASNAATNPSQRSPEGAGETGPETSTTAPSVVHSSTTTTVPATTTTESATAVTPPPTKAGSGRGEGTVDVLVNAKSAFDGWTKSPSSSQQKAMRSIYDWMVVYSPYFDKRLSWYPNGLAYIDLYAMYKDTAKDSRSVDHPEWVLADAAGNRLFVDWGCKGGTCPQWAADVGNPEFRADFVARVGALLKKGYPGIMIDDVNLLWRISNGSGDTVAPIDPRTGAEMTLGNWQAYTVGLLEQVRKAYPGAKIMHNAIWYADAPGYGNSYVRRQTAAADWIMLERGATDGGLKGGDGKFSMASFMKFSDFAHGVGTNVLFLDETANSIGEQTYNLAVYLLVNNGGDLVSTEEYSRIAPGSTWAGFTADLGDALGPRYRWNGLWRRDFTRGVVLVNDPGAGAVTVSLDNSYRDLGGATVGSITLGSRSAAVLVAP
jgi:hypothetical protein